MFIGKNKSWIEYELYDTKIALIISKPRTSEYNELGLTLQESRRILATKRIQEP